MQDLKKQRARNSSFTRYDHLIRNCQVYSDKLDKVKQVPKSRSKARYGRSLCVTLTLFLSFSVLHVVPTYEYKRADLEYERSTQLVNKTDLTVQTDVRTNVVIMITEN